MDKRFLRAFLTPSRTVIEGYSLYPWCIKHRLWLEGIESPFMEHEKPIGIPDLILALRLCSEQGIGEPTWREKWLAYRLHADPARFYLACRAFSDHTNTSDSWPKFYTPKDGKGEGGSNIPWVLSIMTNLIKNGITYQDAMQMPESKAIWLSTAFAISAGAKLELLTTEEEELIDHLQQVEDSKKNEPTT